MGSRTTRTLTIPANGAKFAPLSADAQSLDGLNVLLAVIDELHAHRTRGVWDVLDTATGAQMQPLLLAITTAGVEIGGICHEKLGYLEKVLDGVADDDSFFGINFTIDPADDIRDVAVHRKANPNLGVSVQADDLERKIAEAQHSQAALNNILTKHFNVWIRTESSWMSATVWQERLAAVLASVPFAGRYQAALEIWKAFPCWIGVDLGEVRTSRPASCSSSSQPRRTASFRGSTFPLMPSRNHRSRSWADGSEKARPLKHRDQKPTISGSRMTSWRGASR
jgi:phage terminase large subunit-like protein